MADDMIWTIPGRLIPRAIQDGGLGDRVYVKIADPRQSTSILPQVKLDAEEKLKASSKKKVFKIDGQEILARKYPVRL
ncbi:hypothetical protein PanWU01x14_217400 [Parasponia andersonii]|uniref:Uncharacterized protein n=1 Tax=Parasponia andersonii TaxID=3476 RepID=A0A2P5BR40_PARAD|nr:hypothetical protein PanWU01x14_217400 [Parasponia andersonii]